MTHTAVSLTGIAKEAIAARQSFLVALETASAVPKVKQITLEVNHFLQDVLKILIAKEVFAVHHFNQA